MDAWLLAKYAEIEATRAELQGMIALNYYRLGRDETIAYDEKAFQEQADALRRISEEVLESIAG